MRAVHLIQIFLVTILMSFSSSCLTKDKRSGQNYPIEKTDSCFQNPAHSYEVFIPDHKTTDQNLPLLIAVDPHGSGKTAVKQLKEAVTNYPAILVASNLIQNNDPNFVKELKELITDAKKRYPVNDKVYLAGFSGGARMILSYAISHPVDGVLACGAFTGPDQLSSIKCPVMGLLGMTDFNFLETVQYIFDPGKLPVNVHVELINGAHEWPKNEILTNSWGWFRLSEDMYHDPDKVKIYVEKQNTHINALTAADKNIQAVCISRNMGSVESFEKLGSFRKKTQNIIWSESYMNELNKLSDVLRFEVEKRQEYSQALIEQDEAYWKEEIQELNEKVNTEPDEMKQMAYERLKSFLGIACYSYASRFTVQKNIRSLEQILLVYQIIEPENSDMHHFKNMLENMKHNM